jgi:hypothetical protein
MENKKCMKKEKYKLEANEESLKWKEGIIKWEDDYKKETISNKVLPSTAKSVQLKTREVKIANDGMELMFKFLKKIFNGRIWKKSRDAEEFQENRFNYLLERKAKAYSLKFEETHLKC